MIVRLVQISIVAFWLVMTALLFRLVYFPEETRLSEVPPQLVIERFLSRQEPSNLLIFDGNREVGDVTISSGRFGSRERMASRRFSGGVEGAAVELFLSGGIKMAHLVRADDGGEVPNMGFSGLVWLDEEMRLIFLQLEARIPGNPEIRFEIDPRSERYVIARGDEVILDTAGGADASVLSAQAAMLLAASGMALPPGLDVMEGAQEGEPGGAAPVEVVAREGLVTLGAHRIHAYLLDLPLPWGGKLRFVLTKAGELVRIEGLLAYQVVATNFKAIEQTFPEPPSGGTLQPDEPTP
ncbi:hypothetical protein BH23VER1_BH23VER1_35320 [soil metagenome]